MKRLNKSAKLNNLEKSGKLKERNNKLLERQLLLKQKQPGKLQEYSIH